MAAKQEKQDSLICAYILDGQGGGREVWWPDVDGWTPEAGLLWVHLDHTAPKSQEWLRRFSGVDPLVAEALLADDTRPRCAEIDEGLLIILRGVNLNPGADAEDMVAIRLWIDRQRIVSTRHRTLKSIQDIREQIAARHGPRSAGDYLVQVADRLTTRMGPIIDQLEETLDTLQDELPRAGAADIGARLGPVRRQAAQLRRYLAPQREAITRLQTEQQDWLDDMHRAHLHETADRVIRYVEDLDLVRERASVLQDEMMNRLSIQMNKTMYLLSIVGAVVLPLALVADLLGMSVGGIPGAGSGGAFWIIVILLALVAGGEIWLFRRLGWI
jgi:zinc transporter